MADKASTFGTEPLGKLLRQQAVPSSIGILVMSIYGIVDTIFVGHYVGSLGIGAITVVMPITFLISSLGMSIGIGGSSIISRAYGSNDKSKAHRTFGNQMMMTLTLAIFFVIAGYFYGEEILLLFGGKGDIMPYAREYFNILLIGVPFLAWAMMSNNVIRAEGYPKMAMFTLIIPAVTNIILDPILIVGFDMGIAGAAWATTFSYASSAVFATGFFIFGKSNMRLSLSGMLPNYAIIKEITSLGSVTLARQGTISILAIVLNNSLYAYGGEMGVAVYGIINRVLMFANFPVLGVTQGFVPVVGYNYGAKLEERVSQITQLAIRSATIISMIIFTVVMVFADYIVLVFSNNEELTSMAAPALRMVFLATPLLAMSMISSAFFQAIGKARKALILSLSKQGFLLIPLVLILPLIFGINGIWFSFPLADLGAAIMGYFYLKKVNVKLAIFKVQNA